MTRLQQPSVLIVDDNTENLIILSDTLKNEFAVQIANSGARALEIAASDHPPEIILLDVMMPGMDGFEVCRRLKANWATERIPVIFVTALGDVDDEARGFAAGGVDYITKPVSPPIVLARVRTHLALYDQNRALEIAVQQRTQQLQETRLEIIRRLGRAAEYKDNETGLHIIRMSLYCHLIAQGLGMGSDGAEMLLHASPMHDIGKIGIPDRILLKPGPLNDEEWALMKTHPEVGAAIIGRHDSSLLESARVIALTHHERWDGSGYPGHLREREIPIEGRIAAVADVFDALTSVRPYKHAWLIEDACTHITGNSGTLYDPDVVESFQRVMPDIQNVHNRYKDTPGDFGRLFAVHE